MLKLTFKNIAEFNDFIEKKSLEECWNWKGSVSKSHGYITPTFFIRDRNYSARKLAYYLFHNEFPDGRNLYPICNNYLCVNPYHLKIGKNPKKSRGKLDWEKVRNIREQYKSGKTVKELGKEYHISYVAIWRICNNKAWKE